MEIERIISSSLTHYRRSSLYREQPDAFLQVGGVSLSDNFTGSTWSQHGNNNNNNKYIIINSNINNNNNNVV